MTTYSARNSAYVQPLNKEASRHVIANYFSNENANLKLNYSHSGGQPLSDGKHKAFRGWGT